MRRLMVLVVALVLVGLAVVVDEVAGMIDEAGRWLEGE